jgi:hypothetical protein
MSVTPSPIGGFAAQFFDNNGVILSGGKIYTYAAGTTTPQATYTSASGTTPHANPIILDSAGRVPGGEIWLTDGLVYKFVIETATAILIGTYDNITGINSNFVNYTVQEEVITATAGQTVFNLSTINYTPATNSLTVYIDGVNQYVGDSYLETDSNTVTFTSGVHVGGEVKFTTAIQTTTGAVDASIVTYDPPFTGGVITNVEDKLAQYVSVKDFGAVGNGVADDSTAINNALANGGYIYFPAGTYKVTTIVCDSVNKLTVDASAATFTSVYGNLVVINNCDDFTWTGGIFNAGTGANPAYTALGVPYTIPCNFTVFSSNRVNVSKTQINNSLTNAYPSLTAWIVGQGVFDGNQIVNGGDNSLWFFGCFHMVASNNLILNQLAGRGICFQQVNYGAITGNVAEGGKGEAYNVHGSSNIAITGNSVSDLATDAVVLGFSSGIGVEWEENATAPAIAAAIADPLLYNNVFSRNITISGNTISGTDFGIRIGNNLGISGDNYGNQGQVVIDGNNIFFVDTGINTGTSRQVRISNNMISTCAQACVELNMGTDTGGFSGEYVYIANNRFTLFNGNNSSYNAVQFQNGLPVPADDISLTNNEWDTGQFSAGFSNLSGSALACIEDGNVYANGVVSSATKAGLGIQRQFSDQTGASFLSPYLVNKASNEFTQSGAVGDSFTTVFAIPTDASIAAQIQIGISDRVVCFGTIYAHNGTPPALTFTGTGSTYVQLSGGNLQIKGNTSGGSAAYGGLYSIRYSLLNPT